MANTNIDKRTFLGGLDRDTERRLLRNNDYYHALNIRILSSEDGTTGVIENTKSTVNIGYGFPGTGPGTAQISCLYFLPQSGGYSGSINLVVGGANPLSIAASFAISAGLDMQLNYLILLIT